MPITQVFIPIASPVAVRKMQFRQPAEQESYTTLVLYCRQLFSMASLPLFREEFHQTYLYWATRF